MNLKTIIVLWKKRNILKIFVSDEENDALHQFRECFYPLCRTKEEQAQIDNAYFRHIACTEQSVIITVDDYSGDHNYVEELMKELGLL